MAGNPYLQDQANAITSQANNNLMNYQLPSINSGAMMAGGYGGSRHGIAQGLAIGQTNQGISNSLAGMYGQAYEGDQNRGLQQSMQQSQIAAQQKLADQQNQTQRDLGFGNLGLGFTQAGNSFTLGQQQNQNQAQANLNNFSLGQRQADIGQYGAETNRGLGYGQLAQQGDQNAFNNQLNGYTAQLNGLNSLMGWNNQGVNWANQQQQTPIQNLGNLTSIGTGVAGNGSTTTTPYQGSPWLGALGGASLAGQIDWSKLFGGGR